MNPKEWSLPVKRLPTFKKTDSTVLWNNAKVCYEHEMFGQVSTVEYSHDGKKVACLSANHSLLLRVPHTDGAIWNDQSARSLHAARFRSDDKMIGVCTEKRLCVRSVETAFERQLIGHKQDVRDSVFLSSQTVASGSDDTTVRVWDVVTEKEIATGNGHTDYVRTLANHSETTFFSGSYDKSIRLWDLRQDLQTSATSTMMDAQCENILQVPRHNVVVACCGDKINVFDWRNMSEALYQTSVHSKAVTSIAFCAEKDVLLSGSLDQRVKFISFSQGFEVVASKKFAAPVTAVGVHPDATEFGVGFATGKLSMFKIIHKHDEEEDDGTIELLPDKKVESRAEQQERQFKEKIGTIRGQLASHQHQRALRTALFSRMPDVIITTLEELQRRCGLRMALSGHNDRTIVQLLRFLTQHLDNPHCSAICAVGIESIFEIYGEASGKSPFFHKELLSAHARIGESVQALQDVEASLGIMSMIRDA